LVPQFPLARQPFFDEQPLLVPQESLPDFAPAQALHSFGVGEAHPVINPATAAAMMKALVR